MSQAICNTNQEIPQDMLLGNLLFINLTDMKIPAASLKQIFANNQIPENYVRDISQADAFRRASSSIKNRTITLDGNNVRVEIDEVRCDQDSIKRIIGVKKIDSAAEDISYEPVGEILFTRQGGNCIATPLVSLPGADYNTIYDLCTEISNKYGDWSVFHNKDTVRNIINRIINDTHPINLMPTGLCKFTPKTSAGLLYCLKDALTEMSSYTLDTSRENIMEIIPIIDTREQRDLVRKNFRVEMQDELMGMVNELREILQKKQSISSRSAAAYIERLNANEAKIRDYESLLGIYVGSIRAQLAEALQLIDDGKDNSQS